MISLFLPKFIKFSFVRNFKEDYDPRWKRQRMVIVTFLDPFLVKDIFINHCCDSWFINILPLLLNLVFHNRILFDFEDFLIIIIQKSDLYSEVALAKNMPIPQLHTAPALSRFVACLQSK